MLAGLAAGCDGLRVGLEDNVFMSKGVPATNVMLVERAIALARLAGREIATTGHLGRVAGQRDGEPRCRVGQRHRPRQNHPGEKDRTLGNLTTTTRLEAFADVDYVIEAAPEVLEIKQKIFETLDKICSPHVIFATNTTSLSITEIAAATNRPGKFVGMHFFNPVHKMKLIEMVNGLETAAETTRVSHELGESLQKEVVTVKESPGFFTSRIQAVIGNLCCSRDWAAPRT